LFCKWLTSTPKEEVHERKSEHEIQVENYLSNVRKRLFVIDSQRNVCVDHDLVNCEVCRRGRERYEPAQKKIRIDQYVNNVCIKKIKIIFLKLKKKLTFKKFDLCI